MAGRLHVEVVRVGGGLEDNMAGGEETDNNQDTEIQDRKLVCMVRKTDRPRRAEVFVQTALKSIVNVMFKSPVSVSSTD